MPDPSQWYCLLAAACFIVLAMIGVEASAQTTYYVSKDGDDSNPCTEALPCLKINNGISKLSAGDTLLVKGGTYKETLDCTNFPSKNSCIPGGTSWASPTIVRGFPGETVKLRPKAKQNGLRAVHITGENSQYIVLDNLVIDGRGVSQEGIKITSGANHIRINSCTVLNAPTMGILVTGEGTEHNEIVGCTLRDIGSDKNLDHAIYLSTANNLIERNEIFNVTSHGVHLYGSAGMNGNVISDNLITACRYGLGIYGGTGNQVFNNIISSQSLVGLRLRNDYGDLNDLLVCNNTFYGKGTGDIGIEDDSTANPAIIRNNIVFNFEQPLTDSTGLAVLETNLIGVDPSFVDAASGDFHLNGASPAVDAGTTAPQVSTDRDGIARPQGQGYDVGAIEFASSPAAAGRSFFVSTTGSDNNPGTESLPFKTINRGIKSLSGGDMLVIRGGTYDETIVYNIPPSGTDWSKMTTIKGYPGESVVIKPSAGAQTYRVIDFTQVDKQTQFILWENIIFDGANVQYEVVKIGDSYSRMRFVNCEFRNSPSMGVLIPGEHSKYNEFIQCYVHDVGTSTQLQHGFYFEASDQLVDGCLIERAAGHGIHLYGSSGMDRLVVRNTIIRNCERGIGLYGGSGHRIYNNVVYNITGYAMLMRNDQGDLGDVRILNNTFYNSGAELYNFTTNNKLPGSKIINNIAYMVKGGILDDTGRAEVHNNMTDDPLFVDPSKGDFHLQPGSRAIDAGVTLNEVITDFERQSRTQGRAPDIGAYEAVKTSASAGLSPGSGIGGQGQSILRPAFVAAVLLVSVALYVTVVRRRNTGKVRAGRVKSGQVGRTRRSTASYFEIRVTEDSRVEE
ncbi:MAG TPA: right-handed parallel beta-helix repeat-containing protein [Blastocatellia bacterium]|nr:right-handed parallel beta-helix repeat-containing protein [Blastocatellia bacterium]